MVVTHSSRLPVGALLLAILYSSVMAAQDKSTYDPAHPAQSSRRAQGFVDFTLGHINARDIEYGKCLDEDRKTMLEETIENGYFWSNLVSVGLLGCLFLIIVYQHSSRARQDWSVASLLAEQEHSLARSQAQINEVTAKNHALMDTLAAQRETTIRAGALDPAASVAAATNAPQRPAIASTKHSMSDHSERAAAVAIATEPASQIGLFHGDRDFMMTINSLRQQLAHAEEEKKLLRRRITNADRQLAAEQAKNRQLKGE
jgi:hypothetical protein